MKYKKETPPPAAVVAAASWRRQIFNAGTFAIKSQCVTCQTQWKRYLIVIHAEAHLYLLNGFHRNFMKKKKKNQHIHDDCKIQCCGYGVYLAPCAIEMAHIHIGRVRLIFGISFISFDFSQQHHQTISNRLMSSVYRYHARPVWRWWTNWNWSNQAEATDIILRYRTVFCIFTK